MASERMIGVAKDFAFDPLFKAVQPFVFDMTNPGPDRGQWLRYIYIRTEAGDPTPVIAGRAQGEVECRTTNFPFEYQFLDDQLDMQYEAQGRLANSSASSRCSRSSSPASASSPWPVGPPRSARARSASAR
jgi:hypothetical protein